MVEVSVPVPDAVNCWVAPELIAVQLVGLIWMPLMSATSRVAWTLRPLAVAVMVDTPLATPVATPELLMVATPVFDELQVTLPETSSVVLFPSVPVALKFTVLPAATTLLGGETESATMAVCDGKKFELPHALNNVRPERATIRAVTGRV